MTNWPNTNQCLGSDDIMSLGIKSFTTEGVGTKNCSRNQPPFIFEAKGETGTTPLGQGFRTAWLITGQQFQGLGLKLKAFVLTFRDLPSHLCQTIMRVAV